MGKIRVKTLGDEEQEKEQKKEAKKRQDAKKLDKKTENLVGEETSEKQAEGKTEEQTETKKEKVKHQAQKRIRSQKYQDAINKIEKNKTYSLKEALEILPSIKLSSFDETVELHINLTENGIAGHFILPHGTGKSTRVVVADFANDPKSLEELLKQIESGKIDFDVLIATPDSMPKLARVARVLGPRGLMPNPKSGSVTPKPQEVAKKYEGGQINFKSEAKAPLLHLKVGKVSFGTKKLEENIEAIYKALPKNKIKAVTLKSTMSPGIKTTF